jgi:hypothetical protein
LERPAKPRHDRQPDPRSGEEERVEDRGTCTRETSGLAASIHNPWIEADASVRDALATEKKLFTTVCPKMVREAAEILEEMLDETTRPAKA